MPGDNGAYWREQAEALGLSGMVKPAESSVAESVEDDEPTAVEQAFAMIEAAEEAGLDLTDEARERLLTRAEERDAADERVAEAVASSMSKTPYWREGIAEACGDGTVAGLLGRAA